jgi:hypothetical protein
LVVQEKTFFGFETVAIKHCPNQLIKKKVSNFLDKNRAKTDTNGLSKILKAHPNNTQLMPKAIHIRSLRRTRPT